MTDQERIIELRQAGLAVPAIAAVLNVSPEAVEAVEVGGGSLPGGSEPVVARVGDTGFEWQGNYSGDGGNGGVTLQKVGSFVMASGYADYAGAFVHAGRLFKLPADWGDPIGADAVAWIGGTLMIPTYAQTNGLYALNGGGSPPSDGSIQICQVWQLFDPWA